VLVLACAALLAGCGGDGSGGREAQTVIDDEDQQLAEAALLTLADLPSGFQAQAEGDDDEDDEGGDPDCLADLEPDLSELTVTGDAETGNFENETALVSSSAVVYRTEDEAREAFEAGRNALMHDESASCLRDAFAEGVAEGESDVEVEVGEASAEAVSAPDIGEQTVAVRLRIPLEVDGQAVPSFLEFVGVHQGRMIGTLLTFSFGGQFPPEETERLAEIVAGRLSR
jgi:hypothetical protein